MDINNKITVICWALMFGLCLLAIGLREGVFSSLIPRYLPEIKGQEVLLGFGLFIFAEILFFPFIFQLGWFLFASPNEPLPKLFVHPLVIFGGFGALCLLLGLLKKEVRLALLNQSQKSWYKNIGIGVLWWFLAFPFVIVLNESLSLVVQHFFPNSERDQVAVEYLKQILQYPFLFGLTAFEIVTLVPFSEELLFRGLLQTWIKNRFRSTSFAIVSAAFIFSFFHYSARQGLANIELLATLFFLGCILGYLYERQRSLWASVGLHGFFNLVSVAMIFKQE